MMIMMMMMMMMMIIIITIIIMVGRGLIDITRLHDKQVKLLLNEAGHIVSLYCSSKSR
jgi:hypothetical protein